MNTIRRLECFLSIVWRHPTGPGRDGKSKCPRLDIRTAWRLACILNP